MTQVLELSAEEQQDIFGGHDKYIRRIEHDLGVQVLSRDGVISVRGSSDGVRKAVDIIRQLARLSGKGSAIEEHNVSYALEMKDEKKTDDMLLSIDSDVICHTAMGRPVKPKTLGQKNYIDAIRRNLIVFANGPAGTGKTYLAIAMAVTAFQNKEVERIILTRPAIEAGEKLGFLPGDLQSKVDPYLRPLYDALFQTHGRENFQRKLDKGLIEVAPLA